MKSQSLVLVEPRLFLVLPVEPKPKSRPKVFRTKSGDTFTITPGDKVHTENMIRDRLMETEVKFPAGTPIKLDVTFYLARPKSKPKRVELPATRPDLDQYVKLAMDAMSKYVYPDDAAVTTLVARKRYGSPPRIELEMTVDVP